MDRLEPLLQSHDLILMEAAVVERLRRSGDVILHEGVVHAHLVHDEIGRQHLREIYREYMKIADDAGLPILLGTPTWRANRERVSGVGILETVNEDAVRFLGEERDRFSSIPFQVLIGGLIGCRNDCYRPSESLAAGEAEEFHGWQLERLASAGCDYLMAATLPAVPEAVGIARAMAGRGLPYLISFVIGREGMILDGTDLDTAIERIDRQADPAPTGYMINCAHPSFLDPDRLAPSAMARIVGFQANASSLDHSELDSSGTLQVDDVDNWSARMTGLNRKHGVKILGGCCGTSGRHLAAIIEDFKPYRAGSCQ